MAVLQETVHRQNDDLLSAGLGHAGLLTAAPPAFADPAAPTAAEVRRRALWNSWRGIADLMPGGGFGQLYGTLQPVPGREYATLVRLPDARQPHRVVVQVPDNFDADKRCVVVAPSSGSRGVYGAVAVAGPWALPRGCALAYTDKGAGSDYFDLDAQVGVRADGSTAALQAADDFAFLPDAPVNASGVAVKHAHSQDNPESDWGRHVRQAADIALQALNQALPEAPAFTHANTRVIAVGISNGGGAVLRAAEQGQGWLDGVVAGEPNIYSNGAGSRALYDYTTEAAELMPCALLAVDGLPGSPLSAAGRAGGAVRCATLATQGAITGTDTAAQAADALRKMAAAGWTLPALRAGALSVDFDLWRAVAVTYASAYGRYGVGEHPCGYRFSATNADFSPRAATANERAAWLSDGSGVPPGAGVNIVDTKMALPDAFAPGLACLRQLWTGNDAAAQRVQAGIAQTRSAPPPPGLPVMLVHGNADGLIPFAFTSAPYAAAARAAGAEVSLWQVDHVQHFDGFLALPDYAARYLPLLPYVYRALDAMDARLDGKAALPADAHIRSTPRGPGQPLQATNLALPQ
ncbi:hypothetical protein ABB25_05730 [Stenotrophomonas koreensis]|uniref:Hydrogenase n=1 Tax=Stenotrophomonas koreensis TaxID=266128 RepID=A0A0R0BZP0_9GAMM|nr:hypothetical protein ABB25_05730 [Stenotrophomonas koreensis]